MKRMKKYLTLLLALVLCLSMAACGSDGADEDNLYDVPDSFEGLVKDSEQMANLYVYGGAWRGEDGSTMIVATSESGDEVRFALYNADKEVTASGFIQFVPEYDYDYFYNEHDGVAYRSWFDAVSYTHLDTLHSMGVTRLSAVVVTHYHADHTNGLYEVLRRVPVDKLYLPDICLLYTSRCV